MRIAGGRRARFDGQCVWRGLLVVIGQPCCVLGQRGAANSPHAVPPVLLARSSEVPPVGGRDRVQNLPLVLPGRGVFPSGQLARLLPNFLGPNERLGFSNAVPHHSPQQSSTGDTDGRYLGFKIIAALLAQCRTPPTTPDYLLGRSPPSTGPSNQPRSPRQEASPMYPPQKFMMATFGEVPRAVIPPTRSAMSTPIYHPARSRSLCPP